MARKMVIEVKCSRCDRKEFIEGNMPDGAGSESAFYLRMSDGTSVSFEDLCGPCTNAVKTHVEAIGKKINGLSPERKKEKEETPAEPELATEEPVARKKGPAQTPNPSPVSEPQPKAARPQ